MSEVGSIMKQTLIPEDRVLEEVIRAISEGLGIDRARVKRESSLIKDLEAESLDFLDINYRLEQAFGIKTARHSVLEHMEEMFGEESAVDPDGKLTKNAVKVLRLRFNDSAGELKPGMDMDELPTLVTVHSIVEGVMNLLDTLPDACPNCGKRDWRGTDEVRIGCGACSENAAFTNGDELVDQWLTQVQEKEKIF
jgi:acyl carrier protein